VNVTLHQSADRANFEWYRATVQVARCCIRQHQIAPGHAASDGSGMGASESVPTLAELWRVAPTQCGHCLEHALRRLVVNSIWGCFWEYAEAARAATCGASGEEGNAAATGTAHADHPVDRARTPHTRHPHATAPARSSELRRWSSKQRGDRVKDASASSRELELRLLDLAH